jgi:hypothetical protein
MQWLRKANSIVQLPTRESSTRKKQKMGGPSLFRGASLVEGLKGSTLVLTQSLSLSSKTPVPASFDASLTSDTLLHRAATFPELHGVTKDPTARLVRRSTKRALSPVMVCLPFFATSSTIMVSSL